VITQNRPLRDPAGERLFSLRWHEQCLGEQAKQQVLALGRLGRSLRRIQDETGLRRETASIYLKAAGIAIPPPDRRKQRLAKPAIPVTTGSADSQPTPSANFCEPSREAIELGLRSGRICSQAGFRGGYQTVKRFVRKLRGWQTPEACAVIVTGPGEEGPVDYGHGPMVRDPQSGKYRRTRLFVLTLEYSRKAVRLLIITLKCLGAPAPIPRPRRSPHPSTSSAPAKPPDSSTSRSPPSTGTNSTCGTRGRRSSNAVSRHRRCRC
jgi:hypothetical protein